MLNTEIVSITMHILPYGVTSGIRVDGPALPNTFDGSVGECGTSLSCGFSDVSGEHRIMQNTTRCFDCSDVCCAHRTITVIPACGLSGVHGTVGAPLWKCGTKGYHTDDEVDACAAHAFNVTA
jgi:hypothetical protein